MTPAQIVAQAGDNAVEKATLAAAVADDPKLIEHLLRAYDHKRAATRYGCAKVILILSEQSPQLLLPHFSFFRDLLASGKSVFRWHAIQVIANLAKVDSQKKIDKIIATYLKPIEGPDLITAGNTIRGAAGIALAKPWLTGTVVESLLNVENCTYTTDECREIVVGKSMEALELLFPQCNNHDELREFAARHLMSRRPATKKKAERLLKCHRERLKS
jgi:hypothetical protein